MFDDESLRPRARGEAIALFRSQLIGAQARREFSYSPALLCSAYTTWPASRMM